MDQLAQASVNANIGRISFDGSSSLKHAVASVLSVGG
jgi:hypothetical protein